MKRLPQILFLIVALCPVIVLAGQVSSNFVAGDTLTASQLTEIKNAVNDNDSQINQLDIPNYSAGTGIDITNSVVSIHSGTVSIPGSAFKLYSSQLGCYLLHGAINTYIGGGDSCISTDRAIIHAPIQLPDGVRVTSFLCSVLDNSPNAQFYLASLTFSRLQAGNLPAVGLVASSDAIYAGSTGGTGEAEFINSLQAIGNTAVNFVVNNAIDAYTVNLDLRHSATTTFADSGSSLAVSGCKVTYIP